jgi:hypothetical protein
MIPIPNWMFISCAFTSTVRVAKKSKQRSMNARRTIAVMLKLVIMTKFPIIRAAVPSAMISNNPI